MSRIANVIILGTLALGVALVVCGFPRQSCAEGGPEAAEPFIKRGVALRRAGNDVAALREFQRAWEISQTPRTSAQMGLCQQALGQWAPAQARLLEALAAKDDAWIARNRLALEKALASAREHIGHLGIIGDPPGAEVLIGGHLVGTFPLRDPVAVSEGMVDVEVRAPNFQHGMRSVKVEAGQFVELVVRLTPENRVVQQPIAFDPRAEDGAKHKDTGPHPAIAGQIGPSSSDDPKAFYRSPWLWIATGAIVVGAVVVGALVMSGGDVRYPENDKSGKGF